MRFFRCILLLALLAAVTATFFHKKIRGPRPKHGHRISRCSLGKLHYVRPKHHGGKYLRVLGAFALAINLKLKIARDICGFYAKRTIATTLDESLQLIVNAARALAIILENWLSGLGAYFTRIVIGLVRVIFCVLKSAKHGKSYAICGKQFGVKWGFKPYTKGYLKHTDIFDFYGFYDLKENLISVIEGKFGKIHALKGTRRVVINAIIQMANLIGRDIKHWCPDDFVIISRYVITIYAAIGGGHNKETGLAIIEEFIEYLSITFKQAGFKTNISSHLVDIKNDIKDCDKEYFNGALVTDEEDESSSNTEESTNNNTESNSEDDGSSSSNSNSDNQSSRDSSSDSKTTVTTTVTTEEWDVWYDEDGNVVNSTKIEYTN